jgi:prespore-specific regulator
MAAIRQDAWTPDDDLLLAETILRHVREGSTQLRAFEETAQRLGRTAAACGFRWNSVVRKKYTAAIQIAKSQRQKNKQVSGDAPPPQVRTETFQEELSYEMIYRFLKNEKIRMQELTKRVEQLEKQLAESQREVEQLRSENEAMKNEKTHVETNYQTINQDYQTLLKIMDRARKMVVFDDDGEEEEPPKFKMDPNGNLERID